MIRYIAILIVSIQAVRGLIDECYKENFESAEQSAFSSECVHFRYPIWEFKTYGDVTIAAPPTSTSNGYIQTQSGSSCIANNLDLDVVPGSQIEITYFATGSDTRLELYLTLSSLPADVLRLTPELNTWTTATITSTTTGRRTFQLVAYTPTGSVSIDRLTYKLKAGDYEKCDFNDAEPSNPEPTENPEEYPEQPGEPEEPETPETTSGEIPEWLESPNTLWSPTHVQAFSAVTSIIIISICLTILFIILRRRKQNLAAVPLTGQQPPDVFPQVQPLPKEPPPRYELDIPEGKAAYVKEVC